MKQHFFRVVGMYPSTRGFAYAVLEGSDSLVDWGLSRPAFRSDHSILVHAERILSRSMPEILVLEDGRGTKRKDRAQRINDGIAKFAQHKGIPIVRISRSHVKTVFAPAKNKEEIAAALAAMFPELAPRLPRPRLSFRNEDERMSIFDALSFAVSGVRIVL